VVTYTIVLLLAFNCFFLNLLSRFLFNTYFTFISFRFILFFRFSFFVVLSFSWEGEEQGGAKEKGKENGKGNKFVEREAINAADEINDSEGERKIGREGE
jgi:hypothetical protein